jgi:hypothetical protein
MVFWIGLGIAVLAGIRLIAYAFDENWIWGVACLAVPGVILYYGFTRWDTVRTTLLWFVGGLGLMLAHAYMGKS